MTPSPPPRPGPTAARVDQVHFHEVGALDAVADVVGVCYAMYLLAPDKIAASPVHVGSGFVRCAHGVVPVPAPATAFLLEDVPSYGGEVKGELCTPTGAAPGGPLCKGIRPHARHGYPWRWLWRGQEGV